MILERFKFFNNQCKTIGELPFFKYAQCFGESETSMRMVNQEQIPITRESWWNVPFKAERVEKMEDIEELANSVGVMYSPDEKCRPDGILMLGNNRAIVVGVAVYSDKVSNAKIYSQLKSTDSKC